MGLERNLSAGEIVGQVLLLLRQHRLDPRKRPVNIVVMGMGEPLLNLRAVIQGDSITVGSPRYRHVASTRHGVDRAGITPQIDEFGRQPGPAEACRIAYASTQELRRRLMPIYKQVSTRRANQSLQTISPTRLGAADVLSMSC